MLLIIIIIIIICIIIFIDSLELCVGTQSAQVIFIFFKYIYLFCTHFVFSVCTAFWDRVYKINKMKIFNFLVYALI